MANTVSVLIHNSEQVLCAKGYSTRGRFSGIGGKVEPDDANAQIAAVRELTEELFNLAVSPHHLAHITYLLSGGYLHPNYASHTTFHMTFEKLEELMGILSDFGYVSDLYTVFPTTIRELIMKRNKTVPSELNSLSIMQIASVSRRAHLFTYEFIADVKQFGAT